MIRVVVAAPTLALRAGLRTLLENGPFPGPQVRVVDEAGSLSGLAGSLESADVLLLASAGFVEADLARWLHPGTHLSVILLTNNPDEARLLVRLPARAWGILPPDTSAEGLLAALGAVSEGLCVGSPELVETALLHSEPVELPDGGRRAAAAESPAETLTERESQVLQLLVTGLANKQIAAALGISEHTVKFHVSSVYAKLGANSRTEAVRLGVQKGLAFL